VTGRNKQALAICLSLTVLTVIAFHQVSRCSFINFDDPLYVTENIHIQNGITAKAVLWAFTTDRAAYWHPLTWLSHMLDVQLFGLEPRWHHLTNLLFHIANTLLLFYVFNRMTKAPWKSAFVAALFAVHPLHVESVAWVAERKDVLSTFFWLLAMIAYVRYVESSQKLSGFRLNPAFCWTAAMTASSHQPPPGWGGKGRIADYLAVVIFFALSLMAKPMPVTLPFVLLLMDFWPLKRLEPGSPREVGAEVKKPVSGNKIKRKSFVKHSAQGRVREEEPLNRECRHASVYSLLKEKIPLFGLAALSCIAIFITQMKGGAVASLEAISPGVRVANACVSYVIYIEKFLWPANLAVLYPYPKFLPPREVAGAIFFLGAVTLTVILTAKKFPWLAVGWLWYAGTLVPVIGIVQAGSQAMADRFTYMPLVGLFIMAAWGIPELLKRLPRRREILFIASALVLSSLLIVTWIQVGYWRNNVLLYDHTLKVTTGNSFIYCNRGVAYYVLGNYKQAIEDYNRAIETNPELAVAYNDRGAAYDKLGDRVQAVSDFDRAIEIRPEYPDAYNGRGVVYSALGRNEEAISDFDKAIEINQEYAEAYNNRGIVHAAMSNPDKAISDYDIAIGINPGNAEVYYNRGIAYGKRGNHSLAIEDFDRAIEINPAHTEAHFNRCVAQDKLGNHSQAIEDCGRAVEIDPAHAEAYFNRGVAYGELGNYKQAILDFDRVIGLNPEDGRAYFNRAVALAELGDRSRAIGDLKSAARLDDENAKEYLKSHGLSW
jgi:tetratricopeptide (TPR) repeat protein